MIGANLESFPKELMSQVNFNSLFPQLIINKQMSVMFPQLLNEQITGQITKLTIIFEVFHILMTGVIVFLENGVV